MSKWQSICPECGKSFHACNSCGLPYNFELYYCCSECYRKSFKYKEIILDFKRHLRAIYDNPYGLYIVISKLDTMQDLGFFLTEPDIIKYWEELKGEDRK